VEKYVDVSNKLGIKQFIPVEVEFPKGMGKYPDY